MVVDNYICGTCSMTFLKPETARLIAPIEQPGSHKLYPFVSRSRAGRVWKRQPIHSDTICDAGGTATRHTSTSFSLEAAGQSRVLATAPCAGPCRLVPQLSSPAAVAASLHNDCLQTWSRYDRLYRNARPATVDVGRQKPLLWVLREDLEVLGPKYGCGIALNAALAGF